MVRLAGVCFAIAVVAFARPAFAAVSIITGGTSSYLNDVPPTPEIHVIGVYETIGHSFQQHVTGSATVRIKYNHSAPMKPITLVLSSYEATNWNIQRDPGAIVEKVVLNGYYAQSVTGLSGVPVSTYTYAGGGPTLGGSNYAYAWPLSTGGSSTQGLLANLENLLGSRISSFTGAYQASSFSITGSPLGATVQNPRLGAGNLTDGPNPDLIYFPSTGEVKLDLADLAAQYPFGGGSIWWQHFDAQRLFVALANHDGTFNVQGFNAGAMASLGTNPYPPVLNQNRLGFDSVSLRNWHGEKLSLGNILPRGIPDSQQLQNYFAAAHFSTDRQNGGFDLIVAQVPEPSASYLTLCSLIALVMRKRAR